MKKSIFIFLIFSSLNLFSQTFCRTDIMNGEKIMPTNKLTAFVKYDFSNVWLKTENSFVYGIIGDENQRILVKIISVAKDRKNPNEYFVQGKSSVKGNICDFSGKIIIQQIQESKRLHFGPDNAFINLAKTQGLLTAKYKFTENSEQNHTGIFEGALKTKWYLDKKDRIAYDNINSHSDGYFNNSFVGSWKMYNSTLNKPCNWGDFRVSNVACDFDIGTGEFNVSNKYWNNGWLDFALKNKVPNGSIAETNSSKAEKNWWQ